MAQTLFADDAHPADPNLGFELGWDYARHGVLPAPEQMRPGHSLCQGWRSGQARFGQRARVPNRYTRQWLQLRLDAWQRAIAFEPMTVTPNHLRQLDVSCCPVTREPLAHGAATADDAVVVRLSRDAGYAAGHLAMLSTRAERALGGARDCQGAMQMAAQADLADDGLADGLDAAAWRRLAVLMSFVTKLPHAQAAALPLCVLPPNRLRLINPSQGLQALITHRLGEPGWCQGMRMLADHLPDADLRHDLYWLVSALLPRAIGLTRDGDRGALRRAREDAWCDERVNRRWQRFVLQLGERQTRSLLARGVGLGLAGVHALVHDDDAAVDGWALRAHGRAARPLDFAADPRAVRQPRVQAALRQADRPSRRAGDRPALRLAAAIPALEPKTAAR